MIFYIAGYCVIALIFAYLIAVFEKGWREINRKKWWAWTAFAAGVCWPVVSCALILVSLVYGIQFLAIKTVEKNGSTKQSK